MIRTIKYLLSFLTILIISCTSKNEGYKAGNLRYLVDLGGNVRTKFVKDFTDSLHKENRLKVPDSLTIGNNIVDSPNYRLYYLDSLNEAYLISFNSGIKLLGHYTFEKQKWIYEYENRGKKYNLEKRTKIKEIFKKEILTVLVQEARNRGVPDSSIFLYGDTIVK